VHVSKGSARRAQMPVREILHAVLSNDGIAFAVAHNHPSGDPTPSVDDSRASALLSQAARATGLKFLEHLVVAGQAWAPVPAPS
jgi:DNA repair protein RadC